MNLMLRFTFSAALLAFCSSAQAQPPMEKDFLSFQKSFKRVGQAFEAREEILKKEFEAKKLVWPAQYLYLRSFKYDSQLEVWVKNTRTDKFKLFKTYKVCALAGGLGPKRLQGDYQVPEGFYYLNEFRPNSNYHLALGVNYPNPSDRQLGDKEKPGGEIYVHGSCVTVGCIPLTDPIIEELYVLAASTKSAGQDFIPLHVMPVMFKKEKSREILDKQLKQTPDYAPLAGILEKAYFYFNQYRQLPNMMVNGKGDYVMVQDYTVPKIEKIVFKPNTEPRRAGSRVINYGEGDFFPSVNTQPQFPGGLTAFQKYIDGVATELTPFLAPGVRRIFIDVSFVIDDKGNVVNVVPSNKANNEMNNLIIDRFEAMPGWAPAIRLEKNVPIKLTQNIMVEAKAVAGEEKDEDDY